MGRRKLVRSDFLPYHVTARTNNREPFHLPLSQMWKILTSELHLATIAYKVEIHAFVLMPNHFHLLITTPMEDLGQVMRNFMSYVTKTSNLHSGRLGRVFGGPYFQSIIPSGTYYAHALKYVYRNPVKAGLTEAVEDYEFSTIHGMLGNGHLPFPLNYPRSGHGIALVPREIDPLLGWLNRPFPNEVEESIKAALRRSVFEIAKDTNTRRLPPWTALLI